MALAGTYVLVAIATQMYAGIGDTGIGLGSPDTHDNVFAALATPIMGHPLDLLLYGAVLASAASSLQTTFIPAARTMLAMSVYRAMPAIFARIHPRHQVPSNATIAAGVLTAAFYAVMTWLSENVLSDTVESLGMMICFYYGLTALSCVWYFRHEYRIGLGPLITKGLLPLLGGGMLAAMFVQLCVTTFDPGYGSGGAIFGVGTVFAIGVGILLLGAVLMVLLGCLTPDEAYAAVDGNTIALLFGMMVLQVELDRSGLLDALTAAIAARGWSASRLLVVVVFAAGLLSALLVTDAACIMATPPVARVC